MVAQELSSLSIIGSESFVDIPSLSEDFYCKILGLLLLAGTLPVPTGFDFLRSARLLFKSGDLRNCSAHSVKISYIRLLVVFTFSEGIVQTVCQAN